MDVVKADKSRDPKKPSARFRLRLMQRRQLGEKKETFLECVARREVRASLGASGRGTRRFGIVLAAHADSINKRQASSGTFFPAVFW